jgi:DNA repair protein RadC
MKILTNNVSEIEVSYTPNTEDSPKITTPREAVEVFRQFFPYSTIALQERFVVAYTNNAGVVLAVYELSIGGLCGTIADPRLILAVALKIAATSILMCHNHPSGRITPSINDIELTRKIKDASGLMDIKLRDHIILAPNGNYYSWSEEGLL